MENGETNKKWRVENGEWRMKKIKRKRFCTSNAKPS